jgi:hypothetical protein
MVFGHHTNYSAFELWQNLRLKMMKFAESRVAFAHSKMRRKTERDAVPLLWGIKTKQYPTLIKRLSFSLLISLHSTTCSYTAKRPH